MKLKLRQRFHVLIGASLLLVAAAPLAGRAADDLELSLVVGYQAGYVSPDGRKILISNQPTQFSVQVRNTASVSKKVYVDRISGALGDLRFEVTEESGARKVISRKKEVGGQGSLWTSRFLEPGAAVVSDIVITPEEWENVTIVPPGEVKRFKVRALYKSEANTLKSDEYEVTVAPGGMPDVMKAPAPAQQEAPPISVVH